MRLMWKEKLSVGVELIDSQHKRLIDLINALGDGADQGQALDDMVDYVDDHFTAEERLMKAASYSGLAEHHAVHATFVRKLVEFTRQHRLGMLTGSDIRSYLQDWLFTHIMETDQEYVPALRVAMAAEPVATPLQDQSIP